MSITTSDIIAIMRTRGRGDPPSALADIFVNPLVRVLGFLNTKIDFARSEQTVDTIVAAIEDVTTLTAVANVLGEEVSTLTARLKNALDDIASNFGLTRRPASPARGSILLMRSADPSTALPINAIIGQRMSAPSLTQDYIISQSLVIDSMAFDAVYNKFGVSVPIEALSTGLVTNADIGMITVLRDTITGIDSITNASPMTGGKDEESDRELAARIKTALSANNIGTKSGYRNLVLQLANVQDATVVGANDPLMSRDLGDGGSIDIYVTDPNAVLVSQLADASNTTVIVPGTWRFIPSRQPIIKEVATVSPTPTAIIPDTSSYNGSIRAQDGIEFSSDPTILGYPVQFQVNDLIAEAQNYIDDPARKMLGADILVKEAIVVDIDVICQIALLSGYSFTTVKTNAENAISQFISTMTIGQSLQLSDVIRIVTEIAGVDKVTIPFQKFNRTTATGTLDTIVAEANEVFRSGTITVTQ